MNGAMHLVRPRPRQQAQGEEGREEEGVEGMHGMRPSQQHPPAVVMWKRMDGTRLVEGSSSNKEREGVQYTLLTSSSIHARHNASLPVVPYHETSKGKGFDGVSFAV